MRFHFVDNFSQKLLHILSVFMFLYYILYILHKFESVNSILKYFYLIPE